MAERWTAWLTTSFKTSFTSDRVSRCSRGAVQDYWRLKATTLNKYCCIHAWNIHVLLYTLRSSIMLRNYNKFTSYNLDDLSQAYWQLKVTAKWVTFTKVADCSILFVVHVGIVACQNCCMSELSHASSICPNSKHAKYRKRPNYES